MERETKMTFSPSTSLKLPGPDNIQRYELSNGITILNLVNPSCESVYITGQIRAGGQSDPVEKLGLADFTASMLMRGTNRFNFQQIHDQLESVGASMNFDASMKNTWFSARALNEDLPLIIQLAAECLQFPTFPENYIERLRGQLLTSLEIREQSTAEMASLRFDQLLFQNHPYGNPQDGFIDTIKRITRDDLQEFHHAYYSPLNMIIAVAGKVETQQVVDLIHAHFGSWSVPARTVESKLPVPPLTHTVREHVEIEEKYQTDIICGCYAPARIAEDFLTIYLGNNILGQFGMMGRIGEKVRSQSGLAYYAASSLNCWEDCGIWEIVAGVNPSFVDETIQLIIDEIRHFVEEPVSEEELRDSQSHLIGRLSLSLESNAGLANALMNIEQFGLGLDYYQRYPGLIQSITADDILEKSKKYLDPEKLIIVSAGTSMKGKVA